MKRRLILAAALVIIATRAHAQEKGGRPVQLKSVRDKASYSIGMNIGSNIKRQGDDVDVNLLIQGLRDATGGKTLLTEEQAAEAMQAFDKEVAAKRGEASKKFLTDNKKRPGVKTTDSGLQYKIIKAGRGVRPKKDDVVTVNYRASMTDGVEFESNGDKPFITPVNQVIPGWEEALQLMDVGSKWQLFIPPDLAYGEQGSPPNIGPNSTLIFELELVQINKPTAPPPAGGGKRPPPPIQ